MYKAENSVSNLTEGNVEFGIEIIFTEYHVLEC